MEDRKEWLEWRHKGIGSSDAPIIHGVSEWATRHELGESKRGPCPEEKPANFAQDKGNNREPIARERFAAAWNMTHGTEETFNPSRCEMATAPFMRASLDGASKDGKTIVEFKTMSDAPEPGQVKFSEGQKAHARVADTVLPVTRKEGGGRVPYHYWIQVQHQLLVSGAERAWFVSYDGATCTECEVLPDFEFFQLHAELCTEFWSLVEKNKPQPLSARDYKPLKVKGIGSLAQKYRRLKLKIDKAEEELEKIREEILREAAADGHPRLTVGKSLSVVRYEGRAGAVDWQKMFNDMKLNYVKVTGEEFTTDVSSYKKPDGKPYYKVEIV